MEFVYQDLNNDDPTTVGRDQIFDAESIAQSLSNLLSTRKGEIPFFPEYGIDLEDSLFELMDDVSALEIFREISEAITLFEARVRLDLANTTVEASVDTGEYKLTIVGVINGKSDSQFEFEGTLSN